MKILVADRFAERQLEALGRLGLEVQYLPHLAPSELAARLPGAGILLVRAKEVTAQAILAADELTLIVRAGPGAPNVDRTAASQRGIFVASCPGKNAMAVAELVFGLILAIDRRLPEQVFDLRAYKWDRKEYGKADGLHGRSLGIVGMGAIGVEVAVRARAFGMPVYAWSRSFDEDRARELGIVRCATPLELAARCDVVSLHVALTSQTRELASDGFFAAMRPGAVFINTARSELMNPEALARAVREKNLRVGLDVHPGEPDTGSGELRHPLLDLPGVYATHHIGASTRQADNAIADEAIRVVRAFLEGGEVPNAVNLGRRAAARWQLVVRHYDHLAVLPAVLGALRRHHVHIEDLENRVFDGAHAACCTLRLSAEPPAVCLEEIRAIADVLHAGLMGLGKE
jgi:D-3-phosphoglycerate dehydrogenase